MPRSSLPADGWGSFYEQCRPALTALVDRFERHDHRAFDECERCTEIRVQLAILSFRRASDDGVDPGEWLSHHGGPRLVTDAWRAVRVERGAAARPSQAMASRWAIDAVPEEQTRAALAWLSEWFHNDGTTEGTPVPYRTLLRKFGLNSLTIDRAIECLADVRSDWVQANLSPIPGGEALPSDEMDSRPAPVDDPQYRYGVSLLDEAFDLVRTGSHAPEEALREVLGRMHPAALDSLEHDGGLDALAAKLRADLARLRP